MAAIRSQRALIALYLAVCAGSAVTAALLKGIWYDEFFSQFFARHDLSLPDTYRLRWAADVHPVFIYFWSWLWEPLVGDDIGHLRLLNLVPTLLAAGALMGIAKTSPLAGRVPLVALLLFVSSPLAFDYFIQDRPYFWIVSSGLVVATIVVLVERGERVSRPLAVLLLGSTVLFMNMQFLCGLFVAAGLSVIALRWWVRGEALWAGLLLVAIGIGSGLILLQAFGQWQTLSVTSAHLWIRTSFAGSLVALVSCIGLTVGGCIVAACTARDVGRDTVACLLFVAVVGLVAIGVNLAKPMIVRQYLCPIVPFLIVAIATASAERLCARRGMLAAALLSMGAVSVAYGVLRSRVKDADRLAAFVGAEVARCSSTRVVGLAPWYGHPGFLLTVEPAVVANAYRELGRKYGFGLDGARSPRCPTIYWSEHSAPPGPGFLPPGSLTLSETGYALVAAPK